MIDDGVQKNPGVSVLFVCLGNICRSPMAEGLFRHHVEEAGLAEQIVCDSCGTGNYHVGENPDSRMIETAMANGLNISNLVARQISEKDFHEFDWILAMDESNFRNIEKLRKRGEGKAVLKLMREFDPQADYISVPDPWFGGMQGFKEVFQILDRSCKNFLENLRKELHLQ